jgi:hypothetical protein
MGFRYVAVDGFPGEPELDSLTGVVVHSNIPSTGTFECSNPMINQLQHNIVRYTLPVSRTQPVWFHRPELRVAQPGKLSVLAVPGQKGRNHDLGALGWDQA